MKLERQLFKISIKEIIWHFVLMFAIMSLFAFIFSVIKGSPDFLMKYTTILLLVFFPLANAVLYGTINRNGVLKITAYTNKNVVKDKIESLLKMNTFTKEKISEEHDRFSNSSNRNKILDYFFRQTLDIEYDDDVIMVFAKRNLLKTIEMKLEFNN
jgi:hypothetical protein